MIKRRLTTSFSLLLFAAKRIWNQQLLMFCLLLGLTLSIALLSSIPLYADAAQNRILQGELTEAGTRRPPFAFMWRYVGAWNGNLTTAKFEPADNYIQNQAANEIGLPPEQTTRYVTSEKMRLFSGEESGFGEDQLLLWSAIGFISDLEGEINLVEGDFPAPVSADEPVPVVVSTTLAERLGLQVGESYIYLAPDNKQIDVTISGIWSATNPADPFWFYPTESFDELLLTNEASYWNNVATQLNEPVATVVWYLRLDGRSVRPGSVAALLTNIRTADARVNALLNGTTLDASPSETLASYSQSASLLIFTLILFSLPIVGLLYYFITLIAGMVVRRDQTEIAILRSRGLTRREISLIYLLQALLLGLLGFALGLPLGQYVARLMGRSQSFLDTTIFSFDGRDLVTVISPTVLLFASVTFVWVILVLQLPSAQAAKYTIVTLRQKQARDLQPPIWQRFYLDLLLFLPTGYAWYQLSRLNSVVSLVDNDDPLTNPLLFLVPILYCLCLGLVALRLLPLLLNGLAKLADYLPSVTLLITLRQLARGVNQYTAPLLLLTFTLALATFTSSMAGTLDDHLFDQIYYQVGADVNLNELGQSTAQAQRPGIGRQEDNDQAEEDEDEGPKWLFLPLSEHLKVSAIKAAARVGDYRATANVGGSQQTGRILGIDRLDFAKVAFYRPDFASNESLGGLLNRLAVSRNYVLVNQEFMARQSLQVGDPLILTVEAGDEISQIEFFIAAPLDYFPTLYAQDGPYFVAHLDYIHEQLGGQFPYHVWLATDEEAPAAEIAQAVTNLGLRVVSFDGAQELIVAEQRRPERQGLFGLLSAGFAAASVLTVLGFLLFAVVSFRRRFIQLGMLRALGLSIRQMAFYLAGEQVAIILTGMGLGTLLGVSASQLFIPYFQIGQDAKALVPPFVVQIAWPQIGLIYTIFGSVFLAVVMLLLLLSLRMKVFEAIKLGETI